MELCDDVDESVVCNFELLEFFVLLRACCRFLFQLCTHCVPHISDPAIQLSNLAILLLRRPIALAIVPLL